MFSSFITVLLARRASGQAMAEYALLLVLVVLAVILVVVTLGGQIANMFTDIAHQF